MNFHLNPMTGAMEDWAYSGSWEGSPIITQPCRPLTYNGYEEKKTLYDKFHKNSIKSIMFLLETSEDKSPSEKLLGKKNKNCLINFRLNAFFNKKKQKNYCREKDNNGYIPKVIRISLLLIDLIKPYINFRQLNKNNNLLIQWSVGGAIEVNETFILFGYFERELTKDILKEIKREKNPENIRGHLMFKTGVKEGKGIWDKNYSKENYFEETFISPEKQGKVLVFIIYAKVDQNWKSPRNSSPRIPPQTHFVNSRINEYYKVNDSKDNFEIEGRLYYNSDVSVVYLN